MVEIEGGFYNYNEKEIKINYKLMVTKSFSLKSS